MSLLDEVAEIQRRLPGPLCSVIGLRETNPTLHAELLAALAAVEPSGKPVPASSISKALWDGHRVHISADMLRRHRAGECAKCRS